METFDAVVVGQGVVGTAAARELAVRGHRVLGLDRFRSGHTRGGSHGESRLIRSVYYEGPSYVPLLRRAYPAWAELEARAGEPLLLRTGGLTVGPPDGRLVSGSRRTAREHGLALEELTPSEVRERFPAFRVPEGCVALVDPNAGVLRAGRCLAALRSGARSAGAEIRFGTPVEGWSAGRDGVEVETGEGTVRAAGVVLAAGGWSRELAPEAGIRLAVERQTVHRFPPGPGDRFGPGRFPGFLLDGGDDTVAYGVPDLGRGVKAALHHGGERAEAPGAIDREVRRGEGARAREAVEELIPGLGTEPLHSEVCVYADTPDRDFVIDRVPGGVVACGFSGHGFKFAPVVAEAAADLLEGRSPPFDPTPFRLGRWEG